MPSILFSWFMHVINKLKRFLPATMTFGTSYQVIMTFDDGSVCVPDDLEAMSILHEFLICF